MDTNSSRPKCSQCNNPVNTEKGLRQGDNEWIHESCYDRLLQTLNNRLK